MQEELEKIGFRLRRWARKYKKDYVTMCILNDTIMANINTKDEDYETTKIYID